MRRQRACRTSGHMIWGRAAALLRATPLYNSSDVWGFAGMMPSWIMRGILDFIWVNIRKDYQGEGIGHELMDHRIQEVRKADGRAIHLMTRSPSYFERRGFSVSRNYGGEGWTLMTLQLGPVEQ